MTTAEQDNKVKLILHCENGSPPYLTPALLATCFPFTSRAVQDHLVFGIAVRDSCVTPVYEPKEKKSKKTKQKSGSKINPPSRQGSAMSDASNSSAKPTGYTFTGRPLHEHLIIPREYSVLACPSFDLIDDGKSGNNNMMKAATATHKEVSLVTPRGHQKLTPNLYHDVVKAMEAQLVIGMYDEASEENAKRNAKSVERTKLWLEEYTNISAEEKKDDESKSTPCKVWAPIVGGADSTLRLECIDSAMKQSSVCGVALIGIHHIFDRQARIEMMQSCTKAIPKSMPCAVLVADSVGQILDAAQNGVQYIGSSLPALLARSRRALALDLYGWRDEEKDGKNGEGRAKKRPRTDAATTTGTIDGCICLEDKRFARDTASFVGGCSCLACAEHKRAYVHHLINAKELLADILLFVHNLHHLLSLFQEMNDATVNGRQMEFVQHIERQLHSS